MISMKTGVNHWSDAKQNTRPDNRNQENVESAKEFKKRFGDKSLGDVLNKITDPNFSPTKSKVKGHENPDLDKDAFFKLMLTQLKHQDPTSPMESHDMAAQLAQFTSLEKMSNIDDTLQDIRKGQQPQNDYQALNLIGKSIMSDSSRVIRTPGDEKHDVNFKIAGDATKVSVLVQDFKGNKVRELEIRNIEKGQHKVTWDGMTEQGFKARPGEYTVSLKAENNQGRKVHTETKVQGIISGVNFTAQGAVLMIGDQAVHMSEVRKIIDPSVEAKTVSKDANNKIKKDEQASHKQIAENGDVKLAPALGNLDQVKMANELVNQVAKVKQAGNK